MKKMDWKKTGIILVVALMLISLPMLLACGGDDEETQSPATTTQPTATKTQPPATTTKPPATTTQPPATTTQPAEVSEFDVIRAAVADYCAKGASSIKNAALNDLIAAGDAPALVDLRSADDYNIGHIPGATNMTFGNLTTLSPDDEYVIYCYTGQAAGFATGMLNVLGYDAKSLSHGMSSWTADAKNRFNAETDQNDFMTETEANEATQTYAYPDVENTTSSDADEILQAAAKKVATSLISASELNDMIANDDAPFIVSVRSATDYAAGHIPGAINIPWKELADNLDKLPPDEPIVVYCYTGQSAAQATAMLQMLGYDAKSLKFGMCSWTQDAAVHLNFCFNPDTSVMYLELEP